MLPAGPAWGGPNGTGPENGTLAISYSRPLGDTCTFTSRIASSYTSPRYSIFFSDPFEFTGTYRQLPGYALVNLRAGVKVRDRWGASVFVENEPQPSFTRIETNQPLTTGMDLTWQF